ncbi:MAG: hypothetical protein AAGA54_08335 [Myxococcota bacterium]
MTSVRDLATLLLLPLVVVAAACDKDSSGTETRTAAEAEADTESSGGASSSSTGEVVPWEPGPHCPRVPFYRCSQPPDPQWVLVDEKGCLPKPCSPDFMQTGCAEGEACVLSELCTPHVAGCYEEGGECICGTDPTCSDYECRVIAG